MSVLGGLAGWAVTFRLGTGLRRREHARLVRRSGLLDVEFYLAQCGQDRAAGADPHMHYVARGAALGLAPSPLFDPAAYLARHPEAAGQNPLVHYLLSERGGGARTSAQPRVAAAPDPAETLLLEHPFPRRAALAVPPRVLVVRPVAGESEGRTFELARAAAAAGEVTLLPREPVSSTPAAATAAGPEGDLAVAHLTAEGPRYAAVVACGLDRASRCAAAVRAFAPWAAFVCDASDARAIADGEGGATRRRAAAVAAASADAVRVTTVAERDAVLRLAPRARVELIPGGAGGLDRLLVARRDAVGRAEDAA